jgi:hypothetical protein
VVLGVAAFGVYHFFPDKVHVYYNKLTGKSDTVVKVKHVKAKDTTRMAPAEDTLTKTAPIIPSERWEIIVSSFNKMPYAAYEVKKLQGKGVPDAKVLTDAPGPRIKVSAGTFNSNKEADSSMRVLVKEKRISRKSYLQSLPIQK